ncbi:serine/threonine protein kinase [Thermosporothrix hazakensis]|jgi:serine/threonine protein kinase|uniref:non-specific serine/threonine protein kinase n=2 Tax=Thermosporothrix TaxID=768650 RepID=A0A326U7A1_THEHA|nr:serine/threonine-protein kinase [Thermosporothrix hazakensis]PZW30653.1 serine/threonine protein kinase [Thermosporothrix hazakensis]BBH91369.1 hypothetical protein KTC_61200 [Thermosporothrix sp. COM3]GCE49516.1 hypothetical protein KTH_43850 [Thermosporothrix hazakensis]
MTLEGQQLDQYRILRFIGRGGMGTVYLARDTVLERDVAIKVIHMNEEFSEAELQENIELFKREARTIAMLDHPFILPLYAFGESQLKEQQNIIYQVMPYRQEGALNIWTRDPERLAQLTPHDISMMITQAAEALQYAHDRQIIHRDVKPSNFLLRDRPDRPHLPDLLLADFGIAHLNMVTRSESREIRGTPLFMAPEQWRGQPVPASDQYALAIMAYEILTGQYPFRGPVPDIMYQHLEETPRVPSEIKKQLPSEVDQVLLRALAKEPEDRYPSIRTFSQALQQALGTTEPPAHSISLSGPVQTRPSTSLKEQSAPTRTPRGIETPSLVRKQTDALSIEALPTQRQTPPAQKRKLPLLVACVIVLLLISLGSIGLYQTLAHPTASETATTAPKTQKQTSAPTTTLPALPYPSYLPGMGKLLFIDPLDKPNKWENVTAPNHKGDCQFRNDAYHIRKLAPHSRQYCSADLSTTNFALEVQMTIETGDCGAVIFRQQKATLNYYYVQLCQNSFVILRKSTNDQPTINLSEKELPPTTKNEPHHPYLIALVVRGSTFQLFVDKKRITEGKDTAFPEGSFALAAISQDHLTEVSFQQFRVWSI